MLIGLLLFAGFPPAAKGDQPVEAETAPAEANRDETALDPAILRPVQHRTMKISDEESDAYFQVLKQAAEVDYRKLKEAARRFQQERRNELPQLRENPELEFPTFVDLFQHPDRYHGQPVTLIGHARRVIKHPMQKNRPEVQTRYEAWIYTEDSQTNPAVVVFTSLPEGMPMGDSILERVAVTGYFFKLYGYDARDTTRLAPLILAPRLEWFPGEKPADEPVSPLLYAVAGGAVLVTLVLILMFLQYTARRDRRFHDAFAAQFQREETSGAPEREIDLPRDL